MAHSIEKWLFVIGISFIGLFSLTPADANSEEALAADSQAKSLGKAKDPKFAVGIGLATVRLDSKIKFTDKRSGDSVFIDPEGTLNLPAVARVDTFYLAYRAAKRHTLGFAYFGINRQTILFDEQFNFEDLIVASATATLSDDTKFYFFEYGFSMHRDDRSNVNVLFGISGLDLRYSFTAEGEITIGNQSRTGVHQEDASIFAPLPLFGLDVTFDITNRWSMNTKAGFVYGEYKDIKANALQASINARFWFNRHLGLLLGLAAFTSNVTQDDASELIEVNYTFGGGFAGVHIVF